MALISTDDFVDQAHADGLALNFVNAYIHQGQQNFVALVSRQPNNSWVARHDLSLAEFESEWNERTEAGLLTRSVTAFDGVQNSHIFAGVWFRP